MERLPENINSEPEKEIELEPKKKKEGAIKKWLKRTVALGGAATVGYMGGEIAGLNESTDMADSGDSTKLEQQYKAEDRIKMYEQDEARHEKEYPEHALAPSLARYHEIINGAHSTGTEEDNRVRKARAVEIARSKGLHAYLQGLGALSVDHNTGLVPTGIYIEGKKVTVERGDYSQKELEIIDKQLEKTGYRNPFETNK